MPRLKRSTHFGGRKPSSFSRSGIAATLNPSAHTARSLEISRGYHGTNQDEHPVGCPLLSESVSQFSLGGRANIG
jgi:hypothetical protein